MKHKESETVELKKSTSELKEAIITIATILNKHQQGELYFGIDDDGEVIGQDISDKTLRDISKTIADNIEPKIYPEISRIKIDNKSCIKVHFKGNNIPYLAFGRTYIRVGTENKQMDMRELERLILEKNKEKLRWDAGICPKAKISDISSQKVKIFLKKCGPKYTSLKNSLKKLKLISEHGKLLNTTIILFGKKPQDFFSNAKLRCAVFGTTDTSYTVDMQNFEGDLFHLIKIAVEYILKNIHIGMKLEGLERVDVPEINEEAFREAIINAFCHRDYYKYDSVNIAIFKDRLEIRSPGLLYGNLTIERIKKEMVSERRNEIIADMFHRVHFIEKWGRGIRLILDRAPDTDFKEVGTHFITVFKRKKLEGSEKKGTTPKTTPKTDESILALIEHNSHITKEEIAKELNITIDGVKYHIRKLRKDGIIKWVGSSKSGHWEVKK